MILLELSFLGACNEVGRSSVAVRTDSIRLLLDCGVKFNSKLETPLFHNTHFDACIITHAHLDHSGAIPLLFKHNNPPVFCTFPTVPLVSMLLEDSVKVSNFNNVPLPYTRGNLNKAIHKMVSLAFDQEYEFFDGTKFSLRDAGHIAGSAGVELESGGKKLFYTGDFRLAETVFNKSAVLPDEADVLIMESTYAFKDHPKRKDLEKSFVESVTDVIDAGGTALLPCFAIGRTQEVMELFSRHAIADVYVDGMGQRVNDVLLEFPSYFRDFKAFERALGFTTRVENKLMRKKIAKSNSIIITTAGMLDGGPVLYYLQQLKNQEAKVFLTGYQVAGTNGDRYLKGLPLDFGRYREEVNLPVKQFDFSAHAGRSDLIKAVKKINPEKVFLIHGEECTAFAKDLREQGFDATAPSTGDSFSV
ncbi:MAG: MBL fold metallo-hydrolase [Candidatus Micrarchaeota archaeon]